MFGHYLHKVCRCCRRKVCVPSNSHVEILTLKVKTVGLPGSFRPKPQSYLTVNICYPLDLGRRTPRWLRDHLSTSMTGPCRGQEQDSLTLVSKGKTDAQQSRGEECTVGVSGIQPSLGKLWGQTTATGGLEGGASSPGGLFLNPEISQSLPS